MYPSTSFYSLYFYPSNSIFKSDLHTYYSIKGFSICLYIYLYQRALHSHMLFCGCLMFFHFNLKAPFRNFCKAGLVVMNNLSFVYLYHFWETVLPDIVFLVNFFSFHTSNTLSYSFLTCKVSAEKSVDNLTGSPLYMTSGFLFVCLFWCCFQDSLSLIFDSLIMCLSVGLFEFILVEVFKPPEFRCLISSSDLESFQSLFIR